MYVSISRMDIVSFDKYRSSPRMQTTFTQNMQSFDCEVKLFHVNDVNGPQQMIKKKRLLKKGAYF